jgi:hypothetical protein
MIRLLQFLAFIFMFRLIWRAVLRLVGGEEAKRMGSRPPENRKTIYRGQMVRDPVCGVYIPEQCCRDGRQYQCPHIGRRGRVDTDWCM